jgi:hypothetical protein
MNCGNCLVVRERCVTQFPGDGGGGDHQVGDPSWRLATRLDDGSGHPAGYPGGLDRHLVREFRGIDPVAKDQDVGVELARKARSRCA